MKIEIIRQAEILFFKKGFSAVILEEICQPLDIKASSLYYHFKGGKEEIYLEVIRNRTQLFKEKIESIAAQGTELSTILKNFGYWYISEPPMNMMIIEQLDMPFLSDSGQKTVNEFIFKSVFLPLGGLFDKHRSELKPEFQSFALVGTLATLLFSIHSALKMSRYKPNDLVDYNINIFLNGAKT